MKYNWGQICWFFSSPGMHGGNQLLPATECCRSDTSSMRSATSCDGSGENHCDQYPPVSSNMVSWEIHEVNGGLKLGKSMINRRLFQLATSDYPRASIYKWVSFYCCV